MRDFEDLTIIENIEEEEQFSRHASEKDIEEAKKKALLIIKKDYSDVEFENLRTVSEWLDEIDEIYGPELEMIKIGKDVNARMYINYEAILRDDILSGYTSYIWVPIREEGKIAILFPTQ